MTETERQCIEAILLATTAFHAAQADAGDYLLVSAMCLLGRGAPGTVWTVAFRPRHLIPAADEPQTAGGEVFMQVDLATGNAHVTGYGE